MTTNTPRADTAAIDLLSRPFCGSTNIDPAEWSGSDGAGGPGCNDCGALADSAELWNRRMFSDARLPGMLQTFTEKMPPGSLTSIGHANVAHALRAVVEFYVTLDRATGAREPAPVARELDVEAEHGNTDHVGRDMEGIVQPYAGAIVLLETIAECGAIAFIDGQRTMNSELCRRFASELRETARQSTAESAPASAPEWQSIETAPKTGRELILLLTPSRFPQVAYSNTWWTSGFSVENKPTHWMPLPAAPSNSSPVGAKEQDK